MEFFGASLPNAVKVVLLSASDPRDAATHAAFAAAFPDQSMSVLSEAEFEGVIGKAMTPADHPIRDWLDRDLLEAVGEGDAEAAETLQVKRKGRGLSHAELKKAKAGAERIGRSGEELLHFYFESGEQADVAAHVWVSDVNAISPYDFQLTLTTGQRVHVDAKSTSGPFANKLHMSLGEIQCALSSGVRYDLYRLFNVGESSASLRVARDVSSKLVNVAAGLAALPSGVAVDSLSFEPDFFDFEPTETLIEYPEEE